MTPLPPGGDAASFDEPIAMLVACHVRMRKQLATLTRLERHLPEHGCDADARVAARAILRYFDSAAVHHHEDEEDSVMPRILARVPEARVLAARLAREHESLGEQWRRLRPLLSGIAAGQRAVLSPRMVLDVAAAYDAHIASEEAEFIPLAYDVLSADELRVIGQEMAGRRGVAIPV
ncbi:MAG: hemerythrin domain-containing protein [Vicinamibacteria bacterium]|jgi:hemerythrin-like domain-containing protein